MILRSWREIRVMMKWRYANLSDEDFVGVQHDREGVLDRIAEKLRKTRTELDMILDELQKL